MSNKEIKEKYDIEPIMKEMWVWDSKKTNAVFLFVALKDSDTHFPYISYSTNNIRLAFRNASETNPNEKEPNIGDWGYFWDDEESFYVFDALSHSNIEKDLKFLPSSIDESFRHFSHEKQPWMK